MSTSGTLGRYTIARKEHLPLCKNTSVIRFKPIKDKYYYSYMYCYLTSNIFNSHLVNMANGSAQVNFGPTHLRQIDVPWPNNYEARTFENDNRYIIKEIIKLKTENNKLKSIRDTLLPKLISGQIDVSKVNITPWKQSQISNLELL